jgi:hypothetical protein
MKGVWEEGRKEYQKKKKKSSSKFNTPGVCYGAGWK